VLVGLLSISGARSRNLFYGRIVERGRRAQTVLVQRRRRVGGRLPARPRAPQARRGHREHLFAAVREMAPRPFIYVERPEIHAEQRLASFWSQVLGNAGAGS
jgi:hypothetical protein